MQRLLNSIKVSKVDLKLLEKSETSGFKSTASGQFEKEVFDYFISNGYKVDKRYRPIDFVVSKNGKSYAVEVKLCMGWNKACEAQWQMNLFSAESKIEVLGKIVIFKNFNTDWGKRPKYLKGIEKGWPLWYRDHSEDGSIHLLQFQYMSLQSFPKIQQSTWL